MACGVWHAPRGSCVLSADACVKLGGAALCRALTIFVEFFPVRRLASVIGFSRRSEPTPLRGGRHKSTAVGGNRVPRGVGQVGLPAEDAEDFRCVKPNRGADRQRSIRFSSVFICVEARAPSRTLLPRSSRSFSRQMYRENCPGFEYRLSLPSPPWGTL
ncbi:hypothetical protein TGPRC2_281660 [Toxoplasma gondii TgCatPRC2]|uniref:Uncharacterized protein n=1 Tax=Toxoplasma gondii TgCatPRC2 TaxID=1130821 RepID=A0A151HBH6_TOXGO|nr:hypothetical protein TGPRC2_281660 [Toxoplasma gondii TgCatPRC2]